MVTHVALAEIGDGYRGGISHIKPLSANVIDVNIVVLLVTVRYRTESTKYYLLVHMRAKREWHKCTCKLCKYILGARQYLAAPDGADQYKEE